MVRNGRGKWEYAPLRLGRTASPRTVLGEEKLIQVPEEYFSNRVVQ